MGTKLGTVVLGVCDCGLKLTEVSHVKLDGPSAWPYERAQQSHGDWGLQEDQEGRWLLAGHGYV